MSKVQLQGNASGTGIFTIASPNSNTDRTLTLPDNTGTVITTGSTGGVSQAMLASGVASNGPAFAAYNSAGVNLSNDVWVKVTFDTELYDTASCYNTSNYRFTPTVAGYYLITADTWVTWDGSSPRGMSTAIYKNGSIYRQNKILTASGSVLYGNTPVSDIVYLNGSTDYIEFYAQCVLGTTVYVAGNYPQASFCSGVLVRAA